SKYAEPMTLSYRVQFYDEDIGKDTWGGYMRETIQPGQISAGWDVVDGHCSMTRPHYTQIQCAAHAKNYDTVCLKGRSYSGDMLSQGAMFRVAILRKDLILSERARSQLQAQPSPEIGEIPRNRHRRKRQVTMRTRHRNATLRKVLKSSNLQLPY